MNGMTGFLGVEVPDNRVANQRNIAEEVQHFVANELIRKPEFCIDDAGVIQDDCVFQRSAANQPASFKVLDIGYETEGPGTADLSAVRLRSKVDTDFLAPDGIVLKINDVACLGAE